MDPQNLAGPNHAGILGWAWGIATGSVLWALAMWRFFLPRKEAEQVYLTKAAASNPETGYQSVKGAKDCQEMFCRQLRKEMTDQAYAYNEERKREADERLREIREFKESNATVHRRIDDIFKRLGGG